MAKLIHLSPLGALEIPGVLGRPEPGEPFDVDDDLVEGLLLQSDLFRVATPPSKASIDELRAIAESRGIETEGLKKADLVAAIAASENTEGVSE